MSDREKTLPGIRSTLWDLILDESGETRLPSEVWLRRWVLGQRGEHARQAVVQSALRSFARFRRILRNLAEGRLLEDGVDDGSVDGAAGRDTQISEQALRVHLYLLCRRIADDVSLTAANAAFFPEEKPSFLKIFEPGQSPANGRPHDQKDATRDVVQAVHSWLTTNYSVNGIPAPWPTIPELRLDVLVSKPGKILCGVFNGADLRYVESLLPAMSAMRCFGKGLARETIERLLKQQRGAVARNSEFIGLVKDGGRLSDKRRQVFLCAYLMTIEYLAHIARSAIAASPGSSAEPASTASMASIGKSMDLLIENCGGLIPGDRPGGLAHWVTEDMKRVASERLASALQGKRTRTLPKMTAPIFDQLVTRTALMIFASARIGGIPASRTLSIRIPEHQLPSSIVWYEIEVAVSCRGVDGSSQLVRLDVGAVEPKMLEKELAVWATYKWPLPAAAAIEMPDEGTRMIPCGAAFKLSADRQGANLLVIVAGV